MLILAYLCCFSSSAKIVTFDLLESRSSDEVCMKYKQLYQKERITQCSNSPGGQVCSIATQKEEDITAALDRVNFYRYLLNLDPVIRSTDATLLKKMNEGCMMMRANNQLSHGFDSTVSCFTTDGNSALSMSNCFMSSSGACAYASIPAYMDDNSVDLVGHRRWITYPKYRTYATCADGQYSALYVLGGLNSSATVPQVIAYPNPGYFPKPDAGVGFSRYWTLSANLLTSNYNMPADSTASVVCDGTKRTVTVKVDNQNTYSYPGVIQIDFGSKPTVTNSCEVNISSVSADTIWKYNIKVVDCANYVPQTSQPETPQATTSHATTSQATTSQAQTSQATTSQAQTPVPITPVPSDGNFCIGTAEQCGSITAISGSEVGSRIINATSNNLEFHLYDQKITLPISTILSKSIKFIGDKSCQSNFSVTGNNINDMTMNNETKHYFSDLSLSVENGALKFNSIDLVNITFPKYSHFMSQKILGDLDSLFSLFSFSTSKLTAKVLEINGRYPIELYFASATTIIIRKKSKNSQILELGEIKIDQNSEDVNIQSTQPITLKVDDNVPPSSIKKLKIDMSEAKGEDKKLIFSGNWSALPDVSNELQVEIGNGGLLKEGDSIPEFSETQEKKTVNPEPTKKKLGGGAIAGIVIGVLVVVAIIVCVVIYFVLFRNKNNDSSSNK